jgi:glycosyltransferase involved in cell wall biosynthesis
MTNPLISIIIPCFNREILIGETLDSIIAQTYINWECIIVDDGSTDDTAEVIAEYLNKDHRFRFYKRPEDKFKGPSSCRNDGFSKSFGTYILFLDSDDLISADCLKNRVDFVFKNPDFDLYVFKTDVFYDRDFNKKKPFRTSFQDYSGKEYLDLFLEGRAPFCVMGALWSRKSIETLGGFDENLMVLEDPDLHLRAFLLSMKAKTNYLGSVDNFYRKSTVKNDASKSNFDVIVNGNYRYFKKHFVRKDPETRLFALRSFRADILLHQHPNIGMTNKI